METDKQTDRLADSPSGSQCCILQLKMRHNINVHSCCLESLSHNDFADYETEKSPDQRDIHAYLLYLPSDFVDFAFGPGISPCWRG